MSKWFSGLILLTALTVLEACGPSRFYYYCHTGNDIDAETNSAVTRESLKFAHAAFDGDTPQAFNELTDEARKSFDQAQLASVLQGIKASGPYDSLRIEHLMTVTGRGHMQQSTSIVDCAKDATLSENNVRAVITNVPKQAYALVSAKGRTENWLAILWLIPSSGKWQIQSFQVTMATAAGKNADSFLAQARQENGEGHTLNAGVLYAAAGTLADRGSFYRTGLLDLIQKEAQQVIPPQEFRERPPFILKGGGEAFSIIRLSPIAINGNPYLVITLEVPRWKDSQEIEKRNRLLIRTFASRFPEYQSAFSGLVAEATESGGTSGWRTVMENSSIVGK